ncbi:beta-1-6-glucan boisynthesis protein-like protein [Venturia nashicola]|uniref:Beta-1-6-glucan boisynthesis protein-like protein n=1 Tax=Venturia nashicola TaxID=86259 RepID=A0A4Z1P4P9_9PEZI|nr:beta-1-6-glucan boisynthesis protein-like protein [Venturia nashicola]TLD36454.1 beta-1-6-glucan boisynthesis protein-like protein [Venturia nashicola]
MRLVTLPFLLTSILPSVHADVKFTSPAGGETFTGGGSIKAAWTDSGTAPSISDLTTYQLFLCAGGNDPTAFIQLASITEKGLFANGNTAEGSVAVGVGDDTPKNAYFLKMISVASTGGTVTNFSPRFSLSGMTGTFPAIVQAGAKAVSDTAGPASVNQVAGAGEVGPVGGDAASYALPFTAQTGPVRYAPMQKYPATKITAKMKTPLYPTSPYAIATTYLPILQGATTQTGVITWSFSQYENTASAPAPSDPMQQFLNRWRD